MVRPAVGNLPVVTTVAGAMLIEDEDLPRARTAGRCSPAMTGQRPPHEWPTSTFVHSTRRPKKPLAV
jgi:hypothetical protein